MTVTLNVVKVWEFLNHFKDHCQSKGWKTSEHEDWIKRGNEYHNFLWIRTIYPSTFQKIIVKQKCAIREGTSYRVVKTAYTAWLFPEPPPEKLIRTVMDNEGLLKRTAIYDLSSACASKPVCLKVNKTESAVFKEFEKFLQESCEIKVESFH